VGTSHSPAWQARGSRTPAYGPHSQLALSGIGSGRGKWAFLNRPEKIENRERVACRDDILCSEGVSTTYFVDSLHGGCRVRLSWGAAFLCNQYCDKVSYLTEYPRKWVVCRVRASTSPQNIPWKPGTSKTGTGICPLCVFFV